MGILLCLKEWQTFTFKVGDGAISINSDFK